MPEKKNIFRNSIDIISAILIGAWIGIVFWSMRSLFNDQAGIYAENGLIENMQASLLAVSCIVYLAAAAFAKKPGKLIPLFFSLLCYSFVLRELDMEKFNIPYALKFLGSGAGRNATIAAAFIAILAIAALGDFRYYAKAAIGFIKSRAGILLIAGGVFILIGDFFEKFEGIVDHVYFEEITELFAYVLILLSALAARSSMNGATIRPGEREKTKRP
jgi:hypothetical protein